MMLSTPRFYGALCIIGVISTLPAQAEWRKSGFSYINEDQRSDFHKTKQGEWAFKSAGGFWGRVVNSETNAGGIVDKKTILTNKIKEPKITAISLKFSTVRTRSFVEVYAFFANNACLTEVKDRFKNSILADVLVYGDSFFAGDESPQTCEVEPDAPKNYKNDLASQFVLLSVGLDIERTPAQTQIYTFLNTLNAYEPIEANISQAIEADFWALFEPKVNLTVTPSPAFDSKVPTSASAQGSPPKRLAPSPAQKAKTEPHRLSTGIVGKHAAD